MSNAMPKEFEDRYRFSYSQLTAFYDCSWQYYLKRYLKVEDLQNLYSLLGTSVHNSHEAYDNGEIKQEEMWENFKKDFNTATMSGYRFDKDDEKNERYLKNYYDCIKHYFEHFYDEEDIYDEEQESQVWADMQGRVFRGFIDKIYKKKVGKSEKYFIVDHKTSSMYSKKDMWKYSRQLILYTRYLTDQGIKYKDIVIGWNFIKYAKLTFKKPKKYKITIQNDAQYQELMDANIVSSKRSKSFDYEGYEHKEIFPRRDEIGMKLRASLRAILKHECYDKDEIESIVEKTCDTNDLSHIPQHIINKYEIKMEKAFVEIELDKNIYKQAEDEMVSIMEDIENALAVNEDRSEDKLFHVFERPPITKEDMFFCGNLCGVNHQCKYYEEWKNELEVFVDENHKSDINELRGGDDIDLDNMILDFEIEDDKEESIDDINLDIEIEDDEFDINLDDLIIE